MSSHQFAVSSGTIRVDLCGDTAQRAVTVFSLAADGSTIDSIRVLNVGGPDSVQYGDVVVVTGSAWAVGDRPTSPLSWGMEWGFRLTAGGLLERSVGVQPASAPSGLIAPFVVDSSATLWAESGPLFTLAATVTDQASVYACVPQYQSTLFDGDHSIAFSSGGSVDLTGLTVNSAAWSAGRAIVVEPPFNESAPVTGFDCGLDPRAIPLTLVSVQLLSD